MVRLIHRIALFGLIAAFCIPSLGYALKQIAGQRVSESEQRILTPFPEPSGSLRDWTGQVDAHLNDSFGMRMPLIRLARKVRDNLGENPPTVAYGRQGWLFINELPAVDEFEGSGNWDNAQVEAWIESLTSMNQALNNRSIPFAAVIAPDKSRIYPEYTPNDWREGERRFKTAVTKHSGASAAGLLDAEPLLRSLKNHESRIYYMRDTHWSPDGFVPVTQMIMDKLDPDGLRPRSLRTNKSIWSPMRAMDLDRLLGNEDEREPAYLSIRNRFPPGYAIERLTPHSALDPAKGAYATLIARDADTVEDDTLVIVGDSFADAMIPDLILSYGRIVRVYHGVDQYRVTLPHILSYDPDAVLFLAAERNAIRMNAPFGPVSTEGP